MNDGYEIAYMHYALQILWVRITWIKMGFDEMIWNLIRPSTIEDNLSFLDHGIVLSPKNISYKVMSKKNNTIIR